MVTQKMLQEVEHMKQELEAVTSEKEQLQRHQGDFRNFLKPGMRGVIRPAAATPAAAPQTQTNAAGEDLAVKWDYLRGIVLQFLQNNDVAFRRRLLPIISTVLAFDRVELHSIYVANKQWVVEEDHSGCSTFLSAFLGSSGR